MVGKNRSKGSLSNYCINKLSLNNFKCGKISKDCGKSTTNCGKSPTGPCTLLQDRTSYY